MLARPAVEAGEKLGFLPGDLQEKVDPYLRPLYDALFDLVDYERVTRLVEKQVIEIAPLAFMRGRTLADAFVILDEAHDQRTDENVFDSYWFWIESCDHGRCDANRFANRKTKRIS